MSKNMAYELVEAADVETLSSLVTRKLAQGWKLVGIAFANDKGLYQAVALGAKAEKRIRKTSEDQIKSR